MTFQHNFTINRRMATLHLVWLIATACNPFHLPAADPQQAARLAIVSLDPSLRPAADLLTAELSGTAGLNLIERDQLAKVLQEQQLQLEGLTAAQALRVGRILNAHGLAWLQVARVGNREFHTLRVVAVGPGVLLASRHDDQPITDLPAWSRTAAETIAGLASKLVVPQERSIPISVVGLRTVTEQAGGKELERDLSALLVHRLAHQPEFFVLEREQMLALQEEKSWEPATASAFWTGAYLVDGTIATAGEGGSNLTVNIRVRGRNGAAPATIELAGQRNNLIELAEQAARRLAVTLGPQPVAKAWDASSEAADFLREARWAQAFQLHARARTAAEASDVLGLRSAELTRIRIYSHRNEMPAGVFANELVKADLFGMLAMNLERYGGRSLQSLGFPMPGAAFFGPLTPAGAADRASQPGPGWPSPFPQMQTGTPRQSSPPKLDGLVAALELFHDRLAGELVGEKRRPGEPDWRWIGAELLAVGSHALRLAEEPPFNAATNVHAPLLRRWLRQTGDAMIQRERAEVPEVLYLKAFYAPLWYEQPAEVISAWRDILKPQTTRSETFFPKTDASGGGIECDLRDRLLAAMDGTVPLVGEQKDAFQKAMPPLWRLLGQELAGGTNLADRTLGRAILARAAENEAARNLANVLLMASFDAIKDDLLKGRLPIRHLAYLPENGPTEIHQRRKGWPDRWSLSATACMPWARAWCIVCI